MLFNANVIQRQFDRIPYHHFRIKPNDPLFDSTAGLNDAAQSGRSVQLPGGQIYTDQINFRSGGRLYGAGAYFKTFSDLRSDQSRDPGGPKGGETILKWFGGNGSGKTMINQSHNDDIKQDSSAIVDNVLNLTSTGIFDLTIDCDARAWTPTGGRANDGGTRCDIGWFQYRTGNTPILGQNISIIGAAKSAWACMGVYSSGVKNIAIMDCPHSICWIGWNDVNYFNFVNKEIDVNSFWIDGFHFQHNGVMAYEANRDNWVGGGGHDENGNPAGWGVGRTSITRGAAMMMAGRNCSYRNGTFEINGGPIVWGPVNPFPYGPNELSNIYFEANEAGSFRPAYVNGNDPATNDPDVMDRATALVCLVNDKWGSNKVSKMFMHGGNKSLAQQGIRLSRIAHNGNGRVSDTNSADSALDGPADQEAWLKFEQMQFPQDAAGYSQDIYLASGTAKYRWDEGNGKLNTTLPSAYTGRGSAGGANGGVAEQSGPWNVIFGNEDQSVQSAAGNGRYVIQGTLAWVSFNLDTGAITVDDNDNALYLYGLPLNPTTNNRDVPIGQIRDLADGIITIYARPVTGSRMRLFKRVADEAPTPLQGSDLDPGTGTKAIRFFGQLTYEVEAV